MRQSVSDATMQGVAQVIRRFEPPAPVEIEQVPLSSGQEILILRASDNVEAMPFTFDGRAYQRIGTTTSVMPQETYQRLLLERAHARQRWENLPSRFEIEDLDASEIEHTRQGAIAAGRLDPLVSGAVADFLERLGLHANGDGYSMRRLWFLGSDFSRTIHSANCAWHDSVAWTRQSSTINARFMGTRFS
jgi:ATP-dependent DNA helicase RecG